MLRSKTRNNARTSARSKTVALMLSTICALPPSMVNQHGPSQRQHHLRQRCDWWTGLAFLYLKSR
jgi:hypothetical protein